MKKQLIIFILLAIFSSSCYYSDLSTHRLDIISEYNPDISISSNIELYDSISLNDSLFFKYEIVIDTGSMYFTDLYIGSVIIYSSEDLMDSLWIVPSYIEVPGEYTLTQISYFKSYSGSLADKLDAEFISYDTSWTVKFYTEYLK